MMRAWRINTKAYTWFQVRKTGGPSPEKDSWFSVLPDCMTSIFVSPALALRPVLLPDRDQVGEKAKGAGHTGRQFAEERQTRVYVIPVAVLTDQ